MDIQSVGPYSPNTVYGEFTSPFTPKTVTMNVTTSYDEQVEEEEKAARNISTDDKYYIEEEEVFSKNYFSGKPIPKNKYGDMISNPLDNNNLNVNTNNNDINKSEEKNGINSTEKNNTQEIQTFSSSKLESDSIVKRALRNGYSNDEAVVINKAREAYKKNGIITKDPVNALNTCSYIVS